MIDLVISIFYYNLLLKQQWKAIVSLEFCEVLHWKTMTLLYNLSIISRYELSTALPWYNMNSWQNSLLVSMSINFVMIDLPIIMCLEIHDAHISRDRTLTRARIDDSYMSRDRTDEVIQIIKYYHYIIYVYICIITIEYKITEFQFYSSPVVLAHAHMCV